jgi:hypothetical protein
LTPLVVPLHRELKRGTLAGILRDAGVDRMTYVGSCSDSDLGRCTGA